MGSEEGEGGRGWPAVRESRLKRHQREKEERAELLGQVSSTLPPPPICRSLKNTKTLARKIYKASTMT